MPVDVWGTGYKPGADVIVVSRGGSVSVAVKKDTDPAEVWFRRSFDGDVWTGGDLPSPKLVGTLPAGVRQVRIIERWRKGQPANELVITSGLLLLWVSTTMGRDWTPL